MRVDLFTMWFMNGLTSRQSDQAAVFKASMPTGVLPSSSLPPPAPLSTLPLPASRRVATHMNDSSAVILS
jgi:hypothetical protein